MHALAPGHLPSGKPGSRQSELLLTTKVEEILGLGAGTRRRPGHNLLVPNKALGDPRVVKIRQAIQRFAPRSRLPTQVRKHLHLQEVGYDAGVKLLVINT